MELGATFAARWSPIYGKINLIGENILNFDFYTVAGLGMLSSNEYFAQYDSSVDLLVGLPVSLVPQGRQLRVPLNVGVGINFFLNQTIALKLDARNYLYYGLKPQYDPSVPVTESRVYNNFVTSAGISIFIPKMKPRIMNF
jgi:outer membrane beta-barrel protein